MALIPRNLDFTDKDFDSLRARLMKIGAAVWPDFLDTSSPRKFDILLMEMQAWVGELVLYYVDKAVRESKIWTSKERRNLIELLRNILYSMSSPAAATVDVTFALATPALSDVVFPAGSTTPRTKNIATPIVFQLLADLTIPQGQTSAVGSVENSVDRLQSYTLDAQPDRSITLDHSPYLDNTAQVNTGEGGWTQVETFFDSGQSDRHYTVKIDNNDRARLTFGDGRNGAIPDGLLTIDYKTGGGVAGNVAPNTISVLDGTFSDIDGRAVQVTVSNALAASGGDERETMAEARINGPASLRALTRSVTQDDYQTHSNKVPGVERALMLTSDQDSSIAENTGIIFVVPVGGGAPSQALKDAVETQVTTTYPPTITFRLTVQDPLYAVIDVEARVTFDDGADPVTVREAIKTSLATLFALNDSSGQPNTLVDFGANIGGLFAWSDVFNAVRDTEGVRRVSSDGVLLNGLASNVLLNTREFPSLGDVVVVNAAAGGIV